MNTKKKIKVQIEHHDGEIQFTNTDELREKFLNRGEKVKWVDGFIDQLERTGVAQTRFSIYKTI